MLIVVYISTVHIRHHLFWAFIIIQTYFRPFEYYLHCNAIFKCFVATLGSKFAIMQSSWRPRLVIGLCIMYTV